MSVRFTLPARTLAGLVSLSAAGALAVGGASTASAADAPFAHGFDGCGRGDAIGVGVPRSATSLDFQILVGGKPVAKGHQDYMLATTSRMSITFTDPVWGAVNPGWTDSAADQPNFLADGQHVVRVPDKAYAADGSPLKVTVKKTTGGTAETTLTFTQTGATGACTVPRVAGDALSTPVATPWRPDGTIARTTVAIPRIDRVTWKYAVVPAGQAAPTDASKARPLPAASLTHTWQTWHDIDLGAAAAKGAKVVLFEVPQPGVTVQGAASARYEFTLGGTQVTPLDPGLSLSRLFVATDQGGRLRIPAAMTEGATPVPVPDAYTWYYRFTKGGAAISTPTPGLTGAVAGYTQLPAFTGDHVDLAFDNADKVLLVAVPKPGVTWSRAAETINVSAVNFWGTLPVGIDLTGVPSEFMIAKNGQGLALPAMGETLGAPHAVAGDFSSIQWVGSPGDINGDHLTDRLMIDTDGGLWAYYGGAGEKFASRKKVGSGWGAMDLGKTFVARGFTDGRPSLMSVGKSDCKLYRYDLNSDGSFRPAVAVGTGWCQMRQVLSAGDQTGDGFSDVVGIKPNGDYMVYPGDGHGGWSGGPVRKGSDWNFQKVSAPADYTTTVFALTADGTVVRYTSNDRGSWSRPTIALTGFNQSYRVME